MISSVGEERAYLSAVVYCTWGVPDIRGKVSQNDCHCSKVNDISCQACLV